MCSGLHVRVTATRYSCQILIKPEFSRQFSKNTEISNFMKIRREGSELLHADGRTDRRVDKLDDANSHFSQFCERT